MAHEAEMIVLGAALGFVAWTLTRMAARDPETGEDDTSADLVDLGNQVIDYGSEYIEQVDEMSADKNLSAFLMALRYGEGTAGPDGFNLLCGGGRFADYARHPALSGWGGWRMPLAMAQAAGFPNGAVSTAAGAFQINRPTYNRVAAKLGLSDFSPATQIAIAVELIREKGALADAQAGRARVAADKVRKVWASLPGAGYGQHEVASNTFINKYTNAGGTLA
jgi:lysozyme